MNQTEQDTQRDFSEEAIEYLKQEVQNLTDQEYADLTQMVEHHTKEISLEKAESMIYTATHMDEAEALMFQQSAMRSMAIAQKKKN